MSDQDPACPQKAPYKIDLLDTYRYAWCACGLSKAQPFCDGSHTSHPGGLRPIIWTHDKDETRFLCGCKRSKNGQYCDGTHRGL